MPSTGSWSRNEEEEKGWLHSEGDRERVLYKMETAGIEGGIGLELGDGLGENE